MRTTPTGSPCVGRCSLSFGGDFCRGCGRSVEEVRDWNTYSPEQKIAVKEIAARRLEDGNHTSAPTDI